MNNQEIENIMFGTFSTRNVFSKVLPIDLLPKSAPQKSLRPYALVINLSNSNEKGSHWVGVYFDKKPKYDEYFDSYGLGPPKQIERLLGKYYLYNNKQIQNYFSSTCGQHTVYYIFRKSLGDTMQNILDRFSRNLKENDRMIASWTNKNFNYDGKIYDTNHIQNQLDYLLPSRKFL